MSHVLAAVRPGVDGAAVDPVAGAMAALLCAEVRRIDLEGRPAADAAPILAALRAPDAVAAVVARDAVDDAGWEALLQGAAQPLVLVPEKGRAPDRIDRILIPLDGSATAAEAVAEIVQMCAGAGLELIVLHVFDASTVPAYWDQAAHARQCWEQEFLARHCGVPGVRLHLRSGVAGEHVVDVADAEQVDLIALAWSQRLTPGRAGTVRRTVAEAAVPIALIPVFSR
ncbi:universal stress protein [Krasilnikovia sp. MM14-A1004]|uniref:universal stress protein n=1 Tax=Krasilnikovia sp. MM14-A1004 TaxID=3373541 RepID=UPI00399D1062